MQSGSTPLTGKRHVFTFETVSQTARQGDIKQIMLITTQFM